MQTLNTFASDYSDSIDFYIVSFDEGADSIADYVDTQGFSGAGFIAAQPLGSMLADLQVTTQGSFIALNGNGRFLHRQTSGNAAEWPAYLDRLVADPFTAPSARESESQRDQRRRDVQLPS